MGYLNAATKSQAYYGLDVNINTGMQIYPADEPQIELDARPEFHC